MTIASCATIDMIVHCEKNPSKGKIPFFFPIQITISMILPTYPKVSPNPHKRKKVRHKLLVKPPFGIFQGALWGEILDQKKTSLLTSPISPKNAERVWPFGSSECHPEGHPFPKCQLLPNQIGSKTIYSTSPQKF